MTGPVLKSLTTINHLYSLETGSATCHFTHSSALLLDTEGRAWKLLLGSDPPRGQYGYTQTVLHYTLVFDGWDHSTL